MVLDHFILKRSFLLAAEKRAASGGNCYKENIWPAFNWEYFIESNFRNLCYYVQASL